MSKPKKHRESGSWFIAIDIFLVFILMFFVFSLFLWDNEGSAEDLSSAKTLKVFVTVEDDYFADLYQQEGNGDPIRVRFLNEEDAFGTIEWVEGDTYLLRCDMKFITASRYYENVWEMYDLRLLRGTKLSLHTELSDFTATVVSVPFTEFPDTSDNAVTTEPELVTTETEATTTGYSGAEHGEGK